MPSSKPAIPPRPPVRKAQVEVVHPLWLLKALAFAIVAALLCGYATLCLLFYQGEWQLILHPSHIVDRTPAAAGLPYDEIHFDAAETGQPRLTGWWIPAVPAAGTTAHTPPPTILYLHDASGSLSETVPTLALLHSAGANLFAIDYRGFGASDASGHPSEVRMSADCTAALDYLTQTRHIPPSLIVPYGAGLAASLAANLARTHPGLPAVILDNPIPDPAAIAVAARPSRFIPVRLLFGDQFDIATPLASLTTPKLLIDGGRSSTAIESAKQPLQPLFLRALRPRTILTLPATSSDSQFVSAVQQFFQQHLAAQ